MAMPSLGGGVASAAVVETLAAWSVGAVRLEVSLVAAAPAAIVGEVATELEDV